MNITRITLNLTNQKTFTYFKVNYSSLELLETVRKARELLENLNSNDPSGREREGTEKFTKNLGGLISEKLVDDLLRQYCHNSIKITGSQISSQSAEDFQIDHLININNKVYSIETRSSFSYRTSSPNSVITRAFSIIGPYTTSYKAEESPKDFYAFAFYFCKPDQLIENLNKQKLNIYFAGGATKEMMFDNEISQASSLKMAGAHYRVIKPITRGLDAPGFLTKINEMALKK